MKHTFIILSIFGIFLLQLNACKKDSSSTEETKPTATTIPTGFNCKIDGIPFTADSSHLNVDISGVAIMAFKSGTATFELFMDNAALGKHSMDVTNTANNSAYYLETNTGKRYFSTSGETDIATFDSTTNRISGTFSFRGTSDASKEKVITVGTFNINK